MKPVTMYTTPTCVYCRMAKDFFKKHNITFSELDVAEDEVARDEMVRKSGQLGVPVIDIGGEIIVGFDQRAVAKALGL